MLLSSNRATREQIRARRLQLARARPEQHETQAKLLDATMDLVEQRRQPLHLVHHDPRASLLPSKLQAELVWIPQIRLVGPFVQ